MKNEMTTDEANDAAARLDEIRAEVKQLMDEALELTGPERMRAEAYWYGHILGALDREMYPGGSMVTMEETQVALENGDEEDDGSLEYAARVNEL